MFDLFENSSNENVEVRDITLGGREHNIILNEEASVAIVAFDERTGDRYEVPYTVHAGNGGLYIFLPGNRVANLKPVEVDDFIDAYKALVVTLVADLGSELMQSFADDRNDENDDEFELPTNPAEILRMLGNLINKNENNEEN